MFNTATAFGGAPAGTERGGKQEESVIRKSIEPKARREEWEPRLFTHIMPRLEILAWLLCVALLWQVAEVVGRDSLASRQAAWRATVTTSNPAHWYEFEVQSVKEGAPDSASTTSPLPGIYSGNVLVGKQGLVGQAVSLTGGRSAVLLASSGTKKSINSADWSLSFLLLNDGAASQPSEELIRENVQYNEVGTAALKLRQFRAYRTKPRLLEPTTLIFFVVFSAFMS